MLKSVPSTSSHIILQQIVVPIQRKEKLAVTAVEEETTSSVGFRANKGANDLSLNHSKQKQHTKKKVRKKSLWKFSHHHPCSLYVGILDVALHDSKALFILLWSFSSLFFRMDNFYRSVFNLPDCFWVPLVIFFSFQLLHFPIIEFSFGSL